MLTHRDSAQQPRGLPWRFLVCLAMAAFVLRALIPSGFMAAPSTSSLMLSLCEAGGAISVTFDLPPEPTSKHAASDACAFGALAAHAILPETALAPVLTAQAAYAASAIPVHRASPPLPALGPPLGSRAPPSLSS
ncbi:DUF2946 domain-containing protein [Achromobacter mucicolens]|uniref:DUF2946 family protein n=1 Tax=Achromobacter mucicolens TaxID=1389922 RepID=UPI00244C7B95|nr:DUF2946 family protein [Achromobacter mucicolens]MDH0090711.1 DUF2946 domain-containing protein [Achromobacter mucicolens]